MSLNEEEIALLSKGPKFAVSAAIHSIDVQANFCLITNQLRWLYFMNERKTTDVADGDTFTMPKYPNGEHIKYEPPTPNQALETKLRNCFLKIQGILAKAKTYKSMENLTTEEKRALKVLKTKNFTYLPSDKGGDFVSLKPQNMTKLRH